MKPLSPLILLLPFLQYTLALPESSPRLNSLPKAQEALDAIKKREDAASPPDTKYFHEPGGDNELGHYDARFFKGIVAYDEHRPALRHLIRSYLITLRKLGVETWLAHGTLLGWWWNGHIMPWDYDVDVQVSSASLYYLGKNHNRSTYEYKFKDDGTGKMLVREYLLDVNPHHVERGRGDGMNVIDARWIDVSNGMFIDITGLTEREPATQAGIWSCKNFHRYRTRDLYPMRESEFEGVPATVPYSFDRILTEEYGMKSLVTTEWEGHRWEAEQSEWVRFPPPPKPQPEDKPEGQEQPAPQ